MLITKINSMIDKLTPTERKIADYIIENESEIRTLTSYEISNKLKIGQSNIIRFSQKLGYKGFRELQFDTNNYDNELYKEVSDNESTESTNDRIVLLYTNLAKATNSINNPNTIDKCIKRIIESKRIVVYGVGNSNLFAEYLSNNLLKMQLNSFSSTNSHIVYTTISGFNEEDLVILISKTGETREIIKIARICKNYNVPILAITRLAKNKLLKYADYTIYTCNDLSDSRLNATTIRCSQLWVIDMITLNILKTDYNKYREYINESEKMLSDNYYGK